MSEGVIRALAASVEPVALIVVAGVKGSAPRHLGSMMMVRRDGSSVGTVGGGKVELEAMTAAQRCMAEGRSLGLGVELVGAEAVGDAPICGGSVELVVEYVSDAALYVEAAALLERGRGALLANERPAPGESRPGGCLRAVFDSKGAFVAGEPSAPGAVAGAIAMMAEAGLPFAAGEDGFSYCLVRSADRLLVLGGGHVGLALARIAVELDFRVTVGDERPEFADPGRFPAGVETVCGEYRDIVGRFPFGDATYVVVATPAHTKDLECVRAIMGKGYRYAGFVGSRRKTRMILEQLVNEGFDQAEVTALRAPIGVDVGAETPAEIAVSILVEIIAARRFSPALAAMDTDRVRRRG